MRRTVTATVTATVIAAAIVAGCGSSKPTVTGPTTTTPTTPTTPTTKATPPTGPEPCGRPTTTAVATPAAAALLAATIVVTANSAASPTCTTLAPGQTVYLDLGDTAEFVANRSPDLTPATSDVVRVTTRPGPTSQTGFGDLNTTHVIVTLTAVQPGTVSLNWVDCSGTGC